MSARRLLLLAGTSEARHLAERLAKTRGWQATASLAGVTAAPRDLPVPTRRGGFGGAAGLERYLRAEPVAAVIDATHPFAAEISGNVVAACEAAGIPLLRLERPAWVPRPGETWIDCADTEAAAKALPAGARAFLTLGSSGLNAFAERHDVWFLVRSLIKPEATDLPGQQIIGAPGTAAEDEALMRTHDITHLVTKNSGGTARGKLSAAAACRIPMLMIRRPQLAPTNTVSDIDGALSWLASL